MPLRRLPDLVDEVDVDIPVYSLAVPISGTPFHADLRAAGRLLPGDLLDASDGVHVAYQPRRVSADELELALANCMLRSYHPLRVAHRIARRAVNGHWALAMSVAANRSYRGYQTALARTTLDRVSERRRSAADEEVTNRGRTSEAPAAASCRHAFSPETK